MIMCHMIADTDAELRVMADKIGVKQIWHQGDHFDICLEMRSKAVRFGAIEITLRQCSAMNYIRKVTGVLGNPESAESIMRELIKQRRMQVRDLLLKNSKPSIRNTTRKDVSKMSKGIYTAANAERIGSTLMPQSQLEVPSAHYRTQTGVVISLMDLDAVRMEAGRLQAWGLRWLALSNDRARMRRMGALQSQTDYIIGRSIRANRARRQLLDAYWNAQDNQLALSVREPSVSLEDEVAAWRTRFPDHEFSSTIGGIVAKGLDPDCFPAGLLEAIDALPLS
jgi:hypothetical protein